MIIRYTAGCKAQIVQLLEIRKMFTFSYYISILGFDIKFIQTRKTTFIKTKFKISDDQTYRFVTNITVYHIILKLILQRIIITNFCGPVSHLW